MSSKAQTTSSFHHPLHCRVPLSLPASTSSTSTRVSTATSSTFWRERASFSTSPSIPSSSLPYLVPALAHPQISTIFLVDQPDLSPASWSLLLESLYLEVFPPSRRPHYHPKPDKRRESLLCDASMVVARAWETDGTGSFIGEPLAADMLRGVGYKRVGWRFQRKRRGDRLRGALIKRLGKRRLLNSDEVLFALQDSFSREVGFGTEREG